MQITLPSLSSYYGFVTSADGFPRFYILASCPYQLYYASGYVHDSNYVVTNLCSVRAFEIFRSAVTEFAIPSSEIIRYNISDDDNGFGLFKNLFDDVIGGKG